MGREQALHCRRVTVRFRSTREARNRENRSQKYMKIDPKIFFLRRGGGHGMMPPPLNTPLSALLDGKRPFCVLSPFRGLWATYAVHVSLSLIGSA